MLILPTAYLAPVSHYAHLYTEGRALEDRGERYAKQTLRTRCRIATPQGPQLLTLPVCRTHGDGPLTTGQARLSDHGAWRRVHLQALRSAYERTPFFDVLFDDLAAVYADPRLELLADFNAALRRVVCGWLGLDVRVEPAAVSPAAGPADTDLRHAEAPRPMRPYYQVFAARTGFLPDLSIVDLVFNLGLEARLVLRDFFSSMRGGETSRTE